MALPHNHHNFQQHYQQQQQSRSFRNNNNNNLYTIDGQITPPITNNNIQDQSQHPPYVPQFHVVGFAPGLQVPGADASNGAIELQWNESKKMKLKEQDFLENNSQISSVDFLQPRSVSTGLGLSLDNNRMASTGDSSLFTLIGDDIDQELQRHDAEVDRFLKVQGDRLRQAIIQKVQANQLRTISSVEERIQLKLREKEAEVESINKKNTKLEDQIEQLTAEAGAWQQRAKYNENMISTLNYNLQQVYAQSKDSKEGCGDSEVDDTASCYNGRAIDFQLLSKDKNELMTCKVCRVNEVCMLLLPCKHLCLCKECESKLSICPVCQSSKFIGMEVYM
ncbi:hypothetical protein ACFE04_006814 [Oxalis oulophora]